MIDRFTRRALFLQWIFMILDILLGPKRDFVGTVLLYLILAVFSAPAAYCWMKISEESK